MAQSSRKNLEQEKPEKDKPQKNKVQNQAKVARSRARRFAMQAIYQHLLTGDSYSHVAKQAIERNEPYDYDSFLFHEIIEGIAESETQLMQQIEPLLHRSVNYLGYVERAVLLVGAYELNTRQTPPKVVITEAMILAKKFVNEDSRRFVNSVLDKLYHQLHKPK